MRNYISCSKPRHSHTSKTTVWKTVYICEGCDYLCLLGPLKAFPEGTIIGCLMWFQYWENFLKQIRRISKDDPKFLASQKKYAKQEKKAGPIPKWLKK